MGARVALGERQAAIEAGAAAPDARRRRLATRRPAAETAPGATPGADSPAPEDAAPTTDRGRAADGVASTRSSRATRPSCARRSRDRRSARGGERAATTARVHRPRRQKKDLKYDLKSGYFRVVGGGSHRGCRAAAQAPRRKRSRAPRRRRPPPQKAPAADGARRLRRRRRRRPPPRLSAGRGRAGLAASRACTGPRISASGKRLSPCNHYYTPRRLRPRGGRRAGPRRRASEVGDADKKGAREECQLPRRGAARVVAALPPLPAALQPPAPLPPRRRSARRPRGRRPPGSRVAVRFQDGIEYAGTVEKVEDANRAFVRSDDGQSRDRALPGPRRARQQARARGAGEPGRQTARLRPARNQPSPTTGRARAMTAANGRATPRPSPPPGAAPAFCARGQQRAPVRARAPTRASAAGSRSGGPSRGLVPRPRCAGSPAVDARARRLAPRGLR